MNLHSKSIFFLFLFVVIAVNFTLQGMQGNYREFYEKIDLFNKLIQTIHRNDIAQLQAILDTGVNINDRYIVEVSISFYSNDKTTTLLEEACKYDNKEMIEFLLNNGAELTNRCFKNITHYEHNIRDTQLPVITALLKHYSKLSIVDQKNLLPGIRGFLKSRTVEVIYACQHGTHLYKPEIFLCCCEIMLCIWIAYK